MKREFVRRGHYKPDMEQMVKFLCGEIALFGFWYGERPEGEPQYWWRKHLRDAFDASCADVSDEKQGGKG